MWEKVSCAWSEICNGNAVWGIRRKTVWDFYLKKVLHLYWYCPFGSLMSAGFKSNLLLSKHEQLPVIQWGETGRWSLVGIRSLSNTTPLCIIPNYSTTQHGTASTVQHSTAQHSTAQHSTAQYSTVQYSTTRHSTVQQQHSIRLYDWLCKISFKGYKIHSLSNQFKYEIHCGRE